MSIGPMGFFSSIAATPMAESQGSDVDRATQETSVQAHEISQNTKAENAAGVGQTDGEEHETADRDADGRRRMEKPLAKKKRIVRQEESIANTTAAEEPHLSRDASGTSGNELDLSG
jgi:hypothetical protein